jgi:hypothetical protein
MASAQAESDPSPPAYVFTFNSSAQARGHFEMGYYLSLLAGGLGSGKTVLHGTSLLDRARPRDDGRGAAETDQLGGIFTNTQNTLEKGVFVEIAKLFKNLGREVPIYDRKPPLSWVRGWVRDGIEIPPIPRYRNVLTTPDGVHTLCGSLHNQTFHQYETLQLGWIRLEEAINNSLEAIDVMTERVRCLTGGDKNPDCARYHRHTRHWIFNPPRGAHPWLYGKLRQFEDEAKNYYHALRDGETCDGCWYTPQDESSADQPVRVARVHGPELSHTRYPLLQIGVGPTIWIKSRTSDNEANNNRGYRRGLAVNMSKDTARRRLDGEIIEETEGRAYTDFADGNVRPVGYDADRTIYVCLDFNLQPRAAVFAQAMVPGHGEYSTDMEYPGVRHIGVFGEYFYAGEMSDRKFAQALVRGDRGDGCDSQPRYRSEEMRGMPPPCDDSCDDICLKGHWNGLKGHRATIIGFGDQRGTHRTSHDDNLGSSWDIVERVFLKLGNYGRDVPEDQPSPRARVDSVNGKLCNAFDIRSLWVDPRCEELIRDFQQVQWDDNGKELREWRRGTMGTEWHRTHLTDGLGYMIHQLFPGGDGDGGGVESVAVQMERSYERSRKVTYPMARR